MTVPISAFHPVPISPISYYNGQLVENPHRLGPNYNWHVNARIVVKEK